MSKTSIKWRVIETFGYGYAFIPTKKALAKYMKDTGNEGLSHDQNLGACYEIFGCDEMKPHSAVVVSTTVDDEPLHQAISIITHEAVHVFQNLCARINESHPSPEFEAYMIQTISTGLLQDYLTARRPADLKALGF